MDFLFSIISSITSFFQSIPTVLYSAIIAICYVLIFYPLIGVYQMIVFIPLNVWIGFFIIGPILVSTLWWFKDYGAVQYGLQNGKEIASGAWNKFITSEAWRTSILVVRQWKFRGRKLMLQLFNVNSVNDDDRMCIGCMEEVKCIALDPCGHICFCAKCWDTYRNVPDFCLGLQGPLGWLGPCPASLRAPVVLRDGGGPKCQVPRGPGSLSPGLIIDAVILDSLRFLVHRAESKNHCFVFKKCAQQYKNPKNYRSEKNKERKDIYYLMGFRDSISKVQHEHKCDFYFDYLPPNPIHAHFSSSALIINFQNINNLMGVFSVIDNLRHT
uniref:RING-type domain-containing protein n=1 Tax=Strigamia maritima TaxID=126957 RepID=T1IQA7_STRMM